MNIYHKIKCAYRIYLNKFNFSKYPVAVRWNITSNCPNNCQYCCFHKTNKKELHQNDIVYIFKILKKMKIIRMSISGGEPLLNNNLEFIVDNCLKNNISPIINTSGYNIENQLAAVKKIDLIQFSLDGPENIMESVRNKNAFNNLSKAVAIAKKHKIAFSFCCTLTKFNTNLETIVYLINYAKKHNSRIAFQPLKDMADNDYFKKLMPSIESYKNCISYLLKLKSNNNPKSKYIRNTINQLTHIYNWPKYKNIDCAAGKLFFVIQPDGSVVGCDRTNVHINNNANMLHNNLDSILENIKNTPCSGCGFLGALELSNLFKYDLSALDFYK